MRNNKKEMSKWQKEVFIMPADLQSESELIHSLESKPKSESNLIHSHTAPKRALFGAAATNRTRIPAARENAVWGVFGAVGRREPYNLTLESKTYYTQNYDTMR